PKRGLGDHNIAYNNSTPNGVHASVLRPPSWRRSPTGAPKNHAVFRFHTSPIAAPLARRRFVTFFVPIEQKIRQNDPWTNTTFYNNSTPNGVHASVLRPPSWRRSPTRTSDAHCWRPLSH